MAVRVASPQVTSRPGARTEVGLLAPDTPANLEPHELAVSGHLAVLGQDDQPSAALFSFPSRHRHSDAAFSCSFLEPTGLHPTLQLRVTSGRPPVEDSFCALHAYLTLPRTIFADRYQLADELFLQSKNLTALRHMTQPVDLEAPDYAVKLWGSAVLVELAPPTSKADHPWTAEVPLHLRYLAPAPGGYATVEIPCSGRARPRRAPSSRRIPSRESIWDTTACLARALCSGTPIPGRKLAADG